MKTVPASLILFACIAASACSPSPQPPAVGTDPVALMQAADSATAAVGAVEYDFALSGTGDFESVIPPFTGSVMAGKPVESGYPLMLVQFSPDTLESGDILPELTIASDGDSAWVMDRSAMVMTRGALDCGGSDLFEFAFYALMIEFVVADPFLSEIEADSIAFEGTDSVAGVPCDVVYVVYQGGVENARWFIGSDDHLPRRVERIASEGGMAGSQILEISNLSVIDPAPEAGAYRLQDVPEEIVPEEYCSILAVGCPAPDWTLATPDGTAVTLSELEGNVVVLDFWATWCGPCAMAMPGMQALSEEFQDEPVRIIGVNVWEDGDPAAFMSDNGYTYQLVLGGDQVAEEYLVTGIPTFYVIGKDGRIAYSSRGYDPEGEAALRNEILEALEAQ
ncbi:MAG TPA: TlpA disulfide reductase family protein [Candidatus Fermentibacter daniensis]|nr:TlpA family protein disulfide reductase [Candidatus Fermentibacter sp.]NLI02567.1 TlpA family protein disulfide reductase [Candidatus Fermentibacter daniensis]OQC70154.1 MAG: Thiol-disulfide oxidoreductase ResA [candidate division Hyd24-12 bacterium ADurb.Bin004]HOA06072.1 TlpA disulfide reductase family protein [Candidatus Fermentibacter daniensis]HOD18590.1 TlpA disulfide reductase family protein [Candidatus Fermentibacter daniensis]